MPQNYGLRSATSSTHPRGHLWDSQVGGSGEEGSVHVKGTRSRMTRCLRSNSGCQKEMEQYLEILTRITFNMKFYTQPHRGSVRTKKQPSLNQRDAIYVPTHSQDAKDVLRKKRETDRERAWCGATENPCHSGQCLTGSLGRPLHPGQSASHAD